MRAVAGGIMALAAVGLVGAPVAMFATGYYDDKTKVCTIDSKNRNVAYDRDGNREVQMLVYTTDCGVFEVGDSLIKGKWRSGDTFGSLQEGQRYELTYHGWRNGFLSMFPTITEAKPA